MLWEDETQQDDLIKVMVVTGSITEGDSDLEIAINTEYMGKCYVVSV